jgi:hypothetical protein
MELSRGTHAAEDDLFPLTQRAFRTPFKAALSVQRLALSHNQAQLFADRSVPKADSCTLTADRSSIHKQIGLPSVIDAADKIPYKHDVIGANRLTNEAHLRFAGKPVPLLVVASHARAREILPRFLAAPRFRYNVIDS